MTRPNHGVREKIRKFGGICQVKPSQEATEVRKILDKSREVTGATPSQEASGRQEEEGIVGVEDGGQGDREGGGGREIERSGTHELS